MATIALGVVGAAAGSAFGNPMLGFSIGTTVGSLIDASMQHGPQIGKLSDLRFSGSAYGVVIPQVWGASRLGGNIIWMATDSNGNHLIEHKATSGGKGGPSSTTYSYTATFAVAVCRGTTLTSDGALITRNPDLKRVWADDKIVWEKGSVKNAVTLRWYPGSETQTPDSAVVANQNSKTPADPAPAFRGTAYFVIQDMLLTDFSNRVPNFSCEVSTDAVTVGDITGDLMRQVGLSASDVDTSAATTSVTGFKVDSQMSVQDAVQGYLLQYLTDMVEVDGVLRLVPRGSSPVLTIDTDDLGAAMELGAEPLPRITETRQQDTELPRRVNITYYSAEAEKHFQQSTQSDVRQTALIDNITTLSLSLTLTDMQARQMAGQHLDTAWIERVQYAFALLLKYMTLAPADIVLLPVGGNNVRVRILTVETGLPGEIRMTATVDNSDVLTQNVAPAKQSIYNASVGTSKQVPTDFVAWSGAELRDADQLSSGFYVAATGAIGWRGCTVYYSPDSGATWVLAGNVSTKCVFGTTTSVLADGTDRTIWDTSDTVGVSLAEDGALASTTDADVLAGNNNAVVGTEIVGFATATLTGTEAYTLSRLRRGVRNSPMTGHTSGERFVLAAQDLLRVSVPDNLVGVTVQVKCLSDYQSLSDVTAQTLVIAARTPTTVENSVSTVQTQVNTITSKRRLVACLCEAYTPIATGADTAEFEVPYDDDGVSALTFNVRRISLRVSGSGGSPTVRLEKSTGTGAFSASTIGTVTLASGANEGQAISTLGTIASGDKIRFSVLSLGSATGWTVMLEAST